MGKIYDQEDLRRMDEEIQKLKDKEKSFIRRSRYYRILIILYVIMIAIQMASINAQKDTILQQREFIERIIDIFVKDEEHEA